MMQWGSSGGLSGARVSRNIYYSQAFRSILNGVVTGSMNGFYAWDALLTYRFYTDHVWVGVDNYTGVNQINYIVIGTWK